MADLSLFIIGLNLLMTTHFTPYNGPCYPTYDLNMSMVQLNLIHHVRACHTLIPAETLT